VASKPNAADREDRLQDDRDEREPDRVTASATPTAAGLVPLVSLSGPHGRDDPAARCAVAGSEAVRSAAPIPSAAANCETGRIEISASGATSL
jgi:hypothetical protein